jgi:hypothetical protein
MTNKNSSSAEIVKFPGRISRRIACRQPRWSKNGTPEERVAKAAAVVDRPVKPRRSKNGTPEERAAKRAAALPNGGTPAPVVDVMPRQKPADAKVHRAVASGPRHPFTAEEFRSFAEQMSPRQLAQFKSGMDRLLLATITDDATDPPAPGAA